MKYWKYLPLILIATSLTAGCSHNSAQKPAATTAADSQATSQTSIPKALPPADRQELNKVLHH